MRERERENLILVRSLKLNERTDKLFLDFVLHNILQRKFKITMLIKQ